jgi:beta-lactamase regulating signal transducer with metallopeptidase domain
MDNLILYLFEVSVSLALFYSVYWLFLKKETFFAVNRLFLISSILFSFIVPFINASFMKISSPIASRQLIERTYVLGQTASTQAKTIGIFDVLWLIYLIGAGLFLLHFLYKLLKLLRLVKKSSIQKINGVKVVFVEKDLAPFSFFNLVFVNKSNISGDDFSRIVAHEMIHIRQYHSVDLFVMELLTIFQWFNPFVWPYKESLRETHEYLADNAVIAQGCNAAKYQLLIFEQLVGVKLFEFANNFNHSQIKRRITMMTKRKSKRWAKFKVLLVLPLLSFLVLTFADSNTTKDPDRAKQKDADNALITQGDAKDSTQSKDQKKAEDEKKKKELTKKWAIEEAKKIEMSINKLKEKYKATDDPEMRKKIKAKVADLGKQMMKLKEGQKFETEKRTKLKNDGLLELEKLEKEYKATEDQEMKKEIKKKMEELQKKKQMYETKKIEMTIKELEHKYNATDDPELKKKIKEKLSVLTKELQKKKK